MGWYVDTLVTFDADNEAAIQAAKDTLKSFEGNEDVNDDARYILERIAAGDGWGIGGKGDLFSYAYTGNYVRGADVVKYLLPFAYLLFPLGGPHTSPHTITVITQDEQTAVSRIFTIHPMHGYRVTETEVRAIWEDDFQ